MRNRLLGKFCYCFSRNTVRHASTSHPRVCIVGSGPAGFYTAKHLVKYHKSITVDILERFPVPFGFLRFGVAPDHTGIKNVAKHFTELAECGRCRFIGNICVGKDVTVSQLKPFYDGVVLAYGVQDDKKLSIPGEGLPGIYSARAFVGWYNGQPEHKHLSPDLSGETVVVVGQGNVALDVARMLLTPTDLLKKTDMCQHALKVLSSSNIRKVQFLGRGSALEVSFTLKELRAMAHLPGCRAVFNPSDLDLVKSQLQGLPKGRRRLMEFMLQLAENQKPARTGEKEWGMRFFRTPLEFTPNGDGGRVSALKLEVNGLQGDGGYYGTGESEMMKCDLVLRSIGYRSLPIDKSIPFNPRQCVIPNIRGKVTTDDDKLQTIPGVYCSGWIKRGPIGNTPVTMMDAFETAASILEDLEKGELPTPTQNDDALEMLSSLPGVVPTSFKDWEKIDRFERGLGRAQGKPREKVVSVEKMMEIIRSET